MSAALEFLIVLLLILVNGVLAMSEMAVVAARKPRLQQMADEGNEGAATALGLADAPGPFLSTVQIGITLVGILIGAFGGTALGNAIAQWLELSPFLQPYARTIAVGFVVILLTYLTLVLGELVPKQLALRASERISALIAPPMSVLARVTAPLVAILSASSTAILRVIGQASGDEPEVTEEDVRIMLEQGAELGVFEPMEEEIVGQVFRLADQEIGALITRRTEIVWIDELDPLDIVRDKIIESGRSRLPVARGNLDDVTGVVLAKDLLAQCLSNEPLSIAEILHPALFVPESMPALSVVERFKETHSKMAMVIDEYGGFEGLVTVDDVMGALVGDIPEPEEPEEPGAVQRADGSWLVDGLLLLEDLEEIVGMKELPETSEHFRTAGGLVMALLGRLPATGDRVQWGGYWIEVVDMDGRRVDKILLTSADEESQAGSQNEDA